MGKYEEDFFKETTLGLELELTKANFHKRMCLIEDKIKQLESMMFEEMFKSPKKEG